MNHNALVIRDSVLPSRTELEIMLTLAEQFLSSGLLSKEIKTPAAALLIIQKGTELRIPPAYALSNITVIQNKPTVTAELMLSLIFRDHGDDAVDFVETTSQLCTISYKRRTAKDRREYSFTIEDARKAGLLSNQTWTKYPAAMLRARCISAVARFAFPDTIAGMYTPEELGADVDEEGQIVREDSPPSVGHAEPASRGSFTVVESQPEEPGLEKIDLATWHAAIGDTRMDPDDTNVGPWQDRIRAKFFATAKGTVFESDDARHWFVGETTKGKYHGLTQFLAPGAATENDGDDLVEALRAAIRDGVAPPPSAETLRRRFRKQADLGGTTPVTPAQVERLMTDIYKRLDNDTMAVPIVRYLHEDKLMPMSAMTMGAHSVLTAMTRREDATELLRTLYGAAGDYLTVEETPAPVAEQSELEEAVPF